jgi:heat shock protein HslJ
MRKFWNARKVLDLGLAGAALFVAACGGAAEAQIDLGGSAWRLTDLAGGGVVAGSEVTLEFIDGRITGTAGCNGYGSEYTLDDGELALGEAMASTMMWCEGLMEQETAYLAALATADGVTLADGQLTVHTDEGDLVFVTAE